MPHIKSMIFKVELPLDGKSETLLRPEILRTEAKCIQSNLQTKFAKRI